MAFRLIRQRREQRRTAKLEEIFQVDVNEAAISKIQDENGDIAREDFIKFSQDNKLLDFGNVMADGGMRLSVMAATAGVGVAGQGLATKKTRVSQPPPPPPPPPPAYTELICCCSAPPDPELRDRVEVAFNKFDLNQDGFLDWEEFRQIGLDQDMAGRIFRFCDSSPITGLEIESFISAGLDN